MKSYTVFPVIADTSFLISLFVSEDQNHAEAVRIWNQPEVRDVAIPDRVIEELLTVLTYKQGIQFALDTYEKTRASKNTTLRRTSEDEWEQTIASMKTRNKKIGFTDYLLIYLASESEEKVLSFDRQLLCELKK